MPLTELRQARDGGLRRVSRVAPPGSKAPCGTDSTKAHPTQKGRSNRAALCACGSLASETGTMLRSSAPNHGGVVSPQVAVARATSFLFRSSTPVGSNGKVTMLIFWLWVGCRRS